MSLGRAVFVTTSFPRRPGDAAGHFVLGHAQQMLAHGWQVEVIVGGDAPAHSSHDGIIVHWAGGGELFGWPGVAARVREAPLRAIGVLPFAHRVRQILEDRGPFDRAVAHFIVPSAWPLLSTMACPVEVVAHGGDVRLLLALPSWVRRRIIAPILSRDARLYFVSSELRRSLCASLPAPLAARLQRQSAVRLPAVCLPDAEARRSAAAPWLKDKSTPYAVLAGRMVESKRFALGLRAAASTELETLVIGDGPERAHLERVASQLQSNIRFLGRLNRVETLGLIERAAVLLHPSATEAAPTVVLEARALGVPVVACKAGDLALWATTDDGLHLVSPDPLAMARGVRRTIPS